MKTEDTLQKLQKKHLFYVSKQDIEGQYLITVGDFYNEEILAIAYYSIKDYFPDTIIIKYKSDDIAIPKDNKVKVSQNLTQEDNSSSGLWFSLIIVILILIGVIILYIKHIKMIKDNYNQIKFKHDNLEKNKSQLLSIVAQKIKDSMEQIISQRDKILLRPVEELSSDMLKRASENSKNRDELLLDTINNMIIFLQLKSKEIIANNELFNINNILNEISGQILARDHTDNIELVFDVDGDVPKLMIGDGTHICTIILNLLQYVFSIAKNTEVKLEIKVLSLDNDDISMKFSIIGDYDEIDNEDMSKNNLGLYIAKELIILINGELNIDKGDDNNSTIFSVVLPLKLQSIDINQDSNILKLGIKKILIVERSESSAEALEKILIRFGYDTTIKSIENVEEIIDELIYYDILMIDIESIDLSVAKGIEEIKRRSSLKVIGLSNLLNNSNLDSKVTDVIDKHLIKPLHGERVYEVLINIFTEGYDNVYKKSKIPKEKDDEIVEKLLEIDIEEPNNIQDIDEDIIQSIPKVYKGEISNTMATTEDSFKVFKGSKILIVEDNIINQKVLLRVLRHSDMIIDIANNGEEALKMLDDVDGDYNFILMDISMPIMDGYEATKIIRGISDYNHIPIVSLTSLALDHEVKKMYHLGMNAHLSKPMKIGQLYSVFSLFLKRSNSVEIRYRDDSYESDIDYLELEIDGTYIEDSDVLDTHSGIIYSQGSEVLYIEVLREFLDAYSNNFSLFEEYIEAKEYLKVKALTKNMGGLLAAIGANSMTHLLSEINQLFVYQEEKQLSLYVESYTNELKSLINQIEQYIYSRDRTNL